MQLIIPWKGDCIGCVVLLCFVVCMTLLASLFRPSVHISLICFAFLFARPCLLLPSFLPSAYLSDMYTVHETIASSYRAVIAKMGRAELTGTVCQK